MAVGIKLLVISLVYLHQALLSTSTPCSETENSYLWRVEVSPPVYMFGTIHLPYSTVWDNLPENVKRAFSTSRQVLLELQLSDAVTSRNLMECQLLPDNQVVDQVLPAALMKRIESYLKRIRSRLPGWLNETPRSSLLRGGLSASDKFYGDATYNWRRKRPVWVLFLISSLTEENVQNWEEPVLDHFLDNAARRLGKNLSALETPTDHCQPLKRLTDTQVETALRVQLDYLESLLNGPPPTMQRDLSAYRCGNLKALVDSQPFLPIPAFSELTSAINVTESDLAKLQEVEKMLYNKLSTRRNRRMTKSIVSLLTAQRNHSIFIGVGAAHLIGTKSIVDRLQKRGYTVQHVATTDTIDGPSLPGNIVALGDPGSVAQPTILELPAVDAVRPRRPPLAGLSYDVLAGLIKEYIFGGARANNRRKRRAATHSVR